MVESNKPENEVVRLAELWDFNTSDTEGEEHIRLPPVYIRKTSLMWPRQKWLNEEWLNEEAQGLHRVVHTVRDFREAHPPKDRYLLLRSVIQSAAKGLRYFSRELVVASWDNRKPTPLPLRLMGLRRGDLLRKAAGGLGFLRGKLCKLGRKLTPSD